MALGEYLQSEVAQDYADRLLTRWEALRRLVVLGLSASGAAALLAACGGDDDPDPAAPTTTAGGAPPDRPSQQARAEVIGFPGPRGEVRGAYAAPENPTAAVLVIHENRGLTPHFHDLVQRLAGERYAALAVDLLSAEGGTDSLTDPAAAMAALSAAPPDRLLGDLRAGIDELQRRVPGTKVGAVGFCFGGGMAWNLLDAGEARLAAVVPFYGPAPEDADFRRAEAAVLGIYGELDNRVNATRQRAEAALKAAGLTHEIRRFPRADHAFFNETGSRYNEQAAGEAYRVLLDWFDRHLG